MSSKMATYEIPSLHTIGVILNEFCDMFGSGSGDCIISQKEVTNLMIRFSWSWKVSHGQKAGDSSF